MIKRFRAWDAIEKEYWYADENLLFINGAKALELRLTSFELTDVEQYICKIDSRGVMIYENDLIKSTTQSTDRIYQVVWSVMECGFRKVPYGLPYPETKIDEAFTEVIGTIHSQKG